MVAGFGMCIEYWGLEGVVGQALGVVLVTTDEQLDDGLDTGGSKDDKEA
jgi:hypothetical protein